MSDLYDIMRTTFAARDFTDDPVSDEVLFRILDNARFAPSGGNRQGWGVIVIRDRDTRAALGELGREPMRRYTAQVMAGENPWNTIVPSRVNDAAVAKTPLYYDLLDKLVDLPVVLVVTVDLSVLATFDSQLERIGIIGGGSVYPFVWNILLAARHEGLAGCLTTFLAANEPQVQELLGIPSHVAVAALVPIGKPVKQLTQLRRNPVSSFTRVDRHDGKPFELK